MSTLRPFPLAARYLVHVFRSPDDVFIRTFFTGYVPIWSRIFAVVGIKTSRVGRSSQTLEQFLTVLSNID